MGIKLCVIGCGDHATRCHLPALKALAARPGGPALAGCCDVDAAKAEAFREKGGFGVAYTDYADMLKRERPGGVLIATPYIVTPSIACDVARVGVPFLVEKPPAETLAKCMPIADAAKESGVVNAVAFNRRHMPLVLELERRLAARPPVHIDYSMYRVLRTESYFHATAIHGVDLVSFLAGSPYARVDFSYQDLPALGEGVAHIFMDAVFVSGATARLSFVVASGRVHERLLISGLDYTLESALPIWNGSDTPGYIRLFEGDSLKEEAPGGRGEMFETNGFLKQMEAFCAHAQSGKHSPNDILSALDSVHIAECIARRAARYVRE